MGWIIISHEQLYDELVILKSSSKKNEVYPIQVENKKSSTILMFKDVIEKYETRVDVHEYLTNTVLEILLRQLEYINTNTQNAKYTKSEKQSIHSEIYNITTKIKTLMEQLNNLEYIISDLTIGNNTILRHLS